MIEVAPTTLSDIDWVQRAQSIYPSNGRTFKLPKSPPTDSVKKGSSDAGNGNAESESAGELSKVLCA
jgi:hypothetical protein